MFVGLWWYVDVVFGEDLVCMVIDFVVEVVEGVEYEVDCFGVFYVMVGGV